jgi:septal ring factor EnvC (AmiA/AmiB activator)
MIRLEQVRGEMLERFERVDRRFAQSEQRLGRIDQKLTELADHINALRAELRAQRELLALSPAWLSDFVVETTELGPDDVP